MRIVRRDKQKKEKKIGKVVTLDSDCEYDTKPNKKMRKSNSKENLFNHLEDDKNAYLDAQEEINTTSEECNNTCVELDDTRMTITLAEYEMRVLKDEYYWNLWKNHGLNRKQFEDQKKYEKNCDALRVYRENCTMDNLNPEYEMDLLCKIRAFEDEIDARVKEEEEKMNDWLLTFAENNSKLMKRIIQRDDI